MGVILIATECIGFLQLLVFYTLVWKEKKREPEKLGDQDHRPSVDILIATYNEERHVLKKSVAGCLNLDYPKELVNIYLCDDGRRTAIQKLAEELGVHYVTRQNNEHAKAGNLNHAMSCSNGELIVTMDADMVRSLHFCRKPSAILRRKKWLLFKRRRLSIMKILSTTYFPERTFRMSRTFSCAASGWERPF